MEEKIMRTCEKCGAEFADDVNFCTKCGENLKLVQQR